jgi:hypothetical protein
LGVSLESNSEQQRHNSTKDGTHQQQRSRRLFDCRQHNETAGSSTDQNDKRSRQPQNGLTSQVRIPANAHPMYLNGGTAKFLIGIVPNHRRIPKAINSRPVAILPIPSFPRRRESSESQQRFDMGIHLNSGWIPAFAGMTSTFLYPNPRRPSLLLRVVLEPEPYADVA